MWSWRRRGTECPDSTVRPPPRTAHRWAWWWPTSAHRPTESLPLATTSWWQPAHPMRRGPRSRRAALGKNTVKTCQPSGSGWCVSRTSRSRELTVFHIRAPPQLLTCFSGARHAQFSYLTAVLRNKARSYELTEQWTRIIQSMSLSTQAVRRLGSFPWSVCWRRSCLRC